MCCGSLGFSVDSISDALFLAGASNHLLDARSLTAREGGGRLPAGDDV